MSRVQMTPGRAVLHGLLLGAIFVGSFFITSEAKAAPPVVAAASDCHIVPPRGLPQPCDDDMGGWNEDGLIDSAQVGVGCALGALNGAGPWGCAAGALAAAFGIYFGNLEDD